MSHSVVVNLIADQTLFIRGQEINIHDLESITLDAGGCIIAFRLKALDSDKGTIHKELDFEYTHKFQPGQDTRSNHEKENTSNDPRGE